MIFLTTMADFAFDNPAPTSRAEAEAALATGQPDVVCRALVQVALNDPDWCWVQSVCVRLAASSDGGIRGVAATCLGHLARLHRVADVDAVLPILERMLNDPETRGRAEDALDDMAIFLSDNKSQRRVAWLRVPR